MYKKKTRGYNNNSGDMKIPNDKNIKSGEQKLAIIFILIQFNERTLPIFLLFFFLHIHHPYNLL